jgi:cellulose synthase/poly-beta-1,6-N-acetylglucosamine synthase-like glycosyltransferase
MNADAANVNDAPRAAACDPLALAHQRPEWSAREPLSREQRLALISVTGAAILAAALAPLAIARAFVLICTLLYLALACYKLALIHAATRPGAALCFTPEELAARANRPWPRYSILVPLYREPETLPRLARALRALDYPEEQKEIQLLLEADDAPTIAAARALQLPPAFRLTIVPPSFPRTKPKACNIGLHQAGGEYLVIYDADDQPEPDQLKKAVLAFESSPANVACVQSSLNYDNPRQNLLTRWFTAEYSAWFDLQLPGLAVCGAPVPLGGTSNHLRTAALRELYGWDAYNVAEDCDLGIRLHRAGWRTRMLATTTWEEACASLPFWIRQRTRWQKGYIQTWFVHMRNPWKLLRELGPVNFCHYHLLIGGVTFSVRANPVFWLMALVWFVLRPEGVARLFPGPVFAAGAICLFLGNFVFIYVNLLGNCKRKNDDLMKWSLLTPIYWMMMSYSGWRAFIQFFRAPFVWEKTQHGLVKKG